MEALVQVNQFTILVDGPVEKLIEEVEGLKMDKERFQMASVDCAEFGTAEFSDPKACLQIEKMVDCLRNPAGMATEWHEAVGQVAKKKNGMFRKGCLGYIATASELTVVMEEHYGYAVPTLYIKALDERTAVVIFDEYRIEKW